MRSHAERQNRQELLRCRVPFVPPIVIVHQPWTLTLWTMPQKIVIFRPNLIQKRSCGPFRLRCGVKGPKEDLELPRLLSVLNS